ncbi:MAG: hypothetical protein MI747_02380 [Desulfobacterales bacterium]|nr:hypothetical protein [Desulfobacterales bacterium]
MTHSHQKLIHNLMEIGVEAPLIPGFVRSLANACLVNPAMTAPQANKRLKYLGWHDVEIDYHTLQLALNAFEDQGMNELEYKSAPWYIKRFNPCRRPQATTA